MHIVVGDDKLRKLGAVIIPLLYIAICNISQKAIANPDCYAYFIHKLALFSPFYFSWRTVWRTKRVKRGPGRTLPRPVYQFIMYRISARSSCTYWANVRFTHAIPWGLSMPSSAARAAFAPPW